MEASPPAITRISKETLSLLHEAEGFALSIFKEAGYSSGFFVNGLRKRLSNVRGVKRFKVGHAGTLDPFAEGVLVVLGGKTATRQQSTYMKMPKRYRARIKFGASTPSLDPDTEVDEVDANFRGLSEDLTPSLRPFLGEIDQIPPVFSAKHVDGKRAYQLAREGKQVEMKPSQVKVLDIQLIEQGEDWAEIDVLSGSGVYIRSLARDIAAQVGTLGYLETLVRTEAGGFQLDECVRLREALDAA